MKHELRQVITLVGERGWHDPDDHEYTEGSVERGYLNMNREVNALAKHITIHSVSYSHVLMPSPGQVKALSMFATIVYSGDFNIIRDFGPIDGFTGNMRKATDTIIHVSL